MMDFEDLKLMWDDTEFGHIWNQTWNQSEQTLNQGDQTGNQSDQPLNHLSQTLCPTPAGHSAVTPLTSPTTPQCPESGNDFWHLLSTSIYEDCKDPVDQEKEKVATTLCPQSWAPFTPTLTPTPPPRLPSPLPATTQPEQNSQGPPHQREPDDLLKLLLEDSGQNQQSQQGINNGRSREEGKTYIKKPLNAFMLFLKEKRKLLSPEILQKGNRVVNVHLGRMWRSLSEEEKVVYLTDAEQQRLFHKMRHPEWSCKENYGKKSTKPKRKCTSTCDSGHQSKKHITKEGRGPSSVIQASHPFPRVMQPSYLQHYYMQASYLQKPSTENIFVQIPTTNATAIPYPTTSTVFLNPTSSIPYPTRSMDVLNPTSTISYPSTSIYPTTNQIPST